MLGKDHISISLATIFLFLIPLFFLNIIDSIYIVTILISVMIGSLIPDADCGGKATIYYRFPAIDWFMKKVVGKPIVFVFNHLITKKKISVEHEVKDEHRGIIHSPIGVVLSSIILIIPILIFSLVFNLFNVSILLTIFLGIMIGQFLHLLEDSCTISGINWMFPFKTKELSGKIYTFSRDVEKKDIRPMIYGGILFMVDILLVLGFVFDKIKLNIFLLYSILLVFVVLFWIGIIYISNTNEKYWLVRKEHIKNFNRNMRRLDRNVGHSSKRRHNQNYY